MTRRLSDDEKTALRKLRHALDNVRFAVRGLPEIPEYVCLENYFDVGADAQIGMFKAALKRRRKEAGE